MTPSQPHHAPPPCCLLRRVQVEQPRSEEALKAATAMGLLAIRTKAARIIVQQAGGLDRAPTPPYGTNKGCLLPGVALAPLHPSQTAAAVTRSAARGACAAAAPPCPPVLRRGDAPGGQRAGQPGGGQQRCRARVAGAPARAPVPAAPDHPCSRAARWVALRVHLPERSAASACNRLRRQAGIRNRTPHAPDAHLTPRIASSYTHTEV